MILTLADLAAYIGSIFISLVMTVIYPVIVFLQAIQSIANSILIPFELLINLFILVYNLAVSIVGQTFATVLPSTYTLLLMSALSVKIGLVIYHYLKDVEILGCKI
jgi:hypothetical protein